MATSRFTAQRKYWNSFGLDIKNKIIPIYKLYYYESEVEIISMISFE